MNQQSIYKSILVTSAILIFGMLHSPLQADETYARKGAEKDDSGHVRIPNQVDENLKIVYQVSDDKLKDGVSRALFYARKLLDMYNENGISDDKIQYHLVFHSDATNALVNDKTRERLEAAGGATNPNLGILAELIERGVSIELCESSMKQHDVESKDLLPDVATVRGAFPRIISLQHLGHAYVKFE
ncbi:MAG: DsrE family protein [Verrucomicrobiales bacterium]|nr:DsrE family protein [Verrucomicrobiales bacterium]